MDNARVERRTPGSAWIASAGDAAVVGAVGDAGRGSNADLERASSRHVIKPRSSTIAVAEDHLQRAEVLRNRLALHAEPTANRVADAGRIDPLKIALESTLPTSTAHAEFNASSTCWAWSGLPALPRRRPQPICSGTGAEVDGIARSVPICDITTGSARFDEA